MSDFKVIFPNILSKKFNFLFLCRRVLALHSDFLPVVEKLKMAVIDFGKSSPAVCVRHISDLMTLKYEISCNTEEVFILNE